MKRLFRFAIPMMIAGIVSVGVFYACKKDGVSTQKEEITSVKQHKWLSIHGCMIGTQLYTEMTAEAWALFEPYGGYFFYYDYYGNKIWFWPNGTPFYKPGNGTPPPPPPPPIPSGWTPAGKFVQYTLIDIMNAPRVLRKNLVIANMDKPFHPCISLSAKIDEELLYKVVSNEYIISNITETEHTDDAGITFVYCITFSNPRNADDIEVKTVSFSFEKIEE